MIDKRFMSLENSVQMCWLLDFYGGLLTKKQQEILSLYYEEDFSLAEIADEYLVSRQNIHDIISRSCKRLKEYELKLNLVERTLQSQSKLNSAIEYLDMLENDINIELAKENILLAIRQFEGD